MELIGPKPKGKKGRRNAPEFDLRTELYRITGIDWAQVDGIDVLTAQTVMAGAGGKTLNRRTRQVVNRATVAFRNAASKLLRSES